MPSAAELREIEEHDEELASRYDDGYMDGLRSAIKIADKYKKDVVDDKGKALKRGDYGYGFSREAFNIKQSLRRALSDYKSKHK